MVGYCAIAAAIRLEAAMRSSRLRRRRFDASKMTRPSSLLASIILHGLIVVAVAWWVPINKQVGMPGEGGATAEFNAQLLEDPGEESSADESLTPEVAPLVDIAPQPEPEIQRIVDRPTTPVIATEALTNLPAPAVGVQDLELSKPVKKESRPSNRARRSKAGIAGSRAGGGGGSGSYTPPRYARCPAPSYPPAAREAQRAGLALLRVSVDAAGAVVRVALARSSGSRDLDNAALATVRTWKFVPAYLDGNSVAAEVEVPVRFIL